MAPSKDLIDAEVDDNELLPDIIQHPEKSADSTIQDELMGLPIDQGWAWVILFAAILCTVIYEGLMKSFGVFLVEYMKQFSSSTTETGLIMTVYNIVCCVLGILVMNVGLTYMSARTSVCAGTVLLSASYLIAAFAKTAAVLIFTLGAIAGAAVAMIQLPVTATIAVYFHKRRGLANNLHSAGSSLGCLIFGPLYTTMFDYYGYTGTMLATSGIILNILVSGVLLRPPEFYENSNGKFHTNQIPELQDRSKKDEPFNIDGALIGGNNSNEAIGIDEPYNSNQVAFSDDGSKVLDVYKQKYKPVANIPESQISENGSSFKDVNLQMSNTLSCVLDNSIDDELSLPILKQIRDRTTESRRFRTLSEASNRLNRSMVALYSAPDTIHGSVTSLVLHSSSNDDDPVTTFTGESVQDSTNCHKKVGETITQFLKMVFDISLLTDPVFIHFVFLAIVALPGSVMSNVYFVPHATDIGINSQGVSILLIVTGCVDLVSRVSAGYFADRKVVKPTTIVAVGFIVMAVVNNCLRFVRTFYGMLFFVIIQCMCGGVYSALFPVILIENVGIARFKSSLGFTKLFHGGSIAAFFPLTGMLRDKTGNYYLTYHCVSILLVIGAVLALTLPLTYARNQRKKEDEKKQKKQKLKESRAEMGVASQCCGRMTKL